MVSGRWYRVVSALGTVVLTIVAVGVANTAAVQEFVTTHAPLVWRLQPAVLSGQALAIAVGTTVVVVTVLVAPLYKPRPRRILHVIYHAHRRVVLAGLALAAIGYFDYTYRLPRVTLVVTVGLLFVVLPAFLVAIRRQPSADRDRVLIVGDDATEIERVTDALAVEPIGYVGPPLSGVGTATDGGVVVEHSSVGLPHVGGLSRLDDVLVEHDIDTVVFGFATIDRQEFFGALAECHEHGIDAKIHRERADSVLVADEPGAELVDIVVEPWDWQDRMVKRAFDVVFAAGGLLALAPLMCVIAVAIVLDDGRPVFYRQERTAEMGETFSVFKFRTMSTGDEEVAPGEEVNRVTRVGGVLRTTHLDEIPQLSSILVGVMSTVGPRAAWRNEETVLESEVSTWRQRWFVKPGLTGLAQINDVTSEEPRKKLRYDVEYIRRQSLRFDVAIVVRQIWKAFIDITSQADDGDSSTD
jgi:lipopolysaccharide/colanic/teichoic acid biosynthesis glycosyltransferase